MRKLVAEFIGTFFLTAAAAGTGNPVAIGLMIASMVYICGHISGAHFNPAVSLAFFLRKKLSAKDLISYWIVQFIAASVAAGTIYQITGKLSEVAPSLAFNGAVAVEVLCTFVFVLLILSIATSPKLSGNFVYGIVIGFTLSGLIMLGAPLSGAAYNPALALGINWMHQIYLGGSVMTHLVLYTVGPWAGAAIGAMAYSYLNEE